MENFSQPLQWAIDYENNKNFIAEMDDIQERYESILNGLLNITGITASSGMAMSIDNPPVTTPSPNAFLDPVSFHTILLLQYYYVFTHL